MFSKRSYQPIRVVVSSVILVFQALCGPMVLAQETALADPPVFRGQRAMELLIEQCEMGPRTPGSPGNRQLRDFIIKKARNAGLPVSTHCFETEMPMGLSPVELCNVVVSAGPRQSEPGTRLWLGAHFDTRPVCDLDQNPALREQPLTGANDGASGVAVLLHILELMAQEAPGRGVDLIFFDGEDSGTSGAPGSFCIGSQKLAGTLGEFSNPLDPVSCQGLIVLDMIGDRDLFIPMEGYSLRNAPEFTREVFSRALELGLPAFAMSPGRAIFDDHVPFLQKGIPAVDLIDFDYPPWHTTGDTPQACSAASLQQVGTLVTNLIYRP